MHDVSKLTQRNHVPPGGTASDHFRGTHKQSADPLPRSRLRLRWHGASLLWIPQFDQLFFLVSNNNKMQLRTSTVAMSTVLAAFATRSVGAFTAKNLARPFVAVTSSTARHMSSDPGPMPYPDDKMPLYALGTNLAMQVGGQGNFKTLLEDDELEIVLEAFCENLRGTNTQDPRAVLETYGPQLNKLLGERTEGIVERVKKDGDKFVVNFLDCNEEAIKTDSGLIYYSMKDGEGAQPTLSNTVEVHYHGTLTDGTVFDSSVERGQTISFPLVRTCVPSFVDICMLD
jgi:FKBP-type peptidyl-prolyl cis-trans isomerase